jgi:hypothetical protein
MPYKVRTRMLCMRTVAGHSVFAQKNLLVDTMRIVLGDLQVSGAPPGPSTCPRCRCRFDPHLQSVVLRP